MNPYNRIIAEQVDLYRRVNRIPQIQLGEVMGICQASVSARLSGKTCWQIADLAALAAAYPDLRIELPAVVM